MGSDIRISKILYAHMKSHIMFMRSLIAIYKLVYNVYVRNSDL